MTIAQWTVQVAVCDTPRCDKYGPPSEESFRHALLLAAEAGWEVRWDGETRGKTIADTLTFCPWHR